MITVTLTTMIPTRALEIFNERYPMRTAPKRVGRIVWLWSRSEWNGPRAAYWQGRGWMFLTGQWANGATEWSEVAK